jgi:23S rRNA pseudouridine1911/1915/1917 synthase
LVVLPRWQEERIDVFLAGATDLSRRAARRYLSDGRVWRNGNPLRVQSRTLRTGDVIDVLESSEILGVPSVPAFRTPTVLFHDRWLLAADKPTGVLSQSAETSAPDEISFDNQVLMALAMECGKRPFLRMIHRLDRVTSGAVLFVRHRKALPAISKYWAEGRVERLYISVIEGHPSSQAITIDRPIARDRNHTWRFRCQEDGKTAQTEVKVLARLDRDLAVVLCRLITGRTHQVRVHLADSGHPVLGDRLYGSNRPDEAPRPLLHAYSLTLPHPTTGDELKIVSRPPDDFQQFLQNPDISFPAGL